MSGKRPPIRPRTPVRQSVPFPSASKPDGQSPLQQFAAQLDDLQRQYNQCRVTIADLEDNISTAETNIENWESQLVGQRELRAQLRGAIQATQPIVQLLKAQEDKKENHEPDSTVPTDSPTDESLR